MTIIVTIKSDNGQHCDDFLTPLIAYDWNRSSGRYVIDLGWTLWMAGSWQPGDEYAFPNAPPCISVLAFVFAICTFGFAFCNRIQIGWPWQTMDVAGRNLAGWWLECIPSCISNISCIPPHQVHCISNTSSHIKCTMYHLILMSNVSSSHEHTGFLFQLNGINSNPKFWNFVQKWEKRPCLG